MHATEVHKQLLEAALYRQKIEQLLRNIARLEQLQKEKAA